MEEESSMPVREFPTTSSGTRPTPIASGLHLIGLLLILFGTAAVGFLAQHHAAADSTSGGQLADHSKAIHIYLVALLMDWALFYYCYAGVRGKGGTLGSLSSGRWTSTREVLIEVAIAIPFWALWEGVAYGVHHIVDILDPSGTSATVDSLLPQSVAEIAFWILLCLTAGFCEEIAFRGYLQKQFHAFTGSIGVGVVLQGIVFGIAHGYQGWKNVVVITALGLLYGILAACRRDLRVNMISHAWSDMWEGWLKFILFH
jgi:membrane protease YdiL (CAAX protease family)